MKTFHKRVINKLKFENRKLGLNKKLKKDIKLYSTDEKVIFIQSPEHGNLGDHMISIGIKEILLDKYKDNKIFEYSIQEYHALKNNLSQFINNSDKIYLVGGGNFGNLYLHEEEQRRDIIKRFPNNEIIVMPVTITFTDDLSGNKEKEISKGICNSHKNLTIMCRENRSFKFALENYQKNNIILSPDAANYLEDKYVKKFSFEREGVLFCLRSDKEKARDEEKIDKIKDYLRVNNIKTTIGDTHIGDVKVIKEIREETTDKLIKKMMSSKLIVTDRLHGMILSVITNTPAIVFNSSDGKVEESYKAWYKDYGYIFYAEEENNIKKIIEEAILNKDNKNSYPTKEKLEKLFLEELISHE